MAILDEVIASTNSQNFKTRDICYDMRNGCKGSFEFPHI